MGFKPRFRRVTIYWGDAAMREGWQDPNSSGGVVEVASTGYVIERTPEVIKLACSTAETGMVADVQIIPRGMIRRVERL